MNIAFQPVSPADLIHNWPVVEPMLAKAMPCDLQRFLPVDILAELIKAPQINQAWAVREDEQIIAVLVTAIHQFPRRRGLSVFALGGDEHRMAEWFDIAEKALVEYGRRNGCDHFETQGRRGWQRVLGLEPTSVFYTRQISLQGGADA